MRIKGRYKNIRRIAKEFYGNSGPELEYINLSIEKSIYTYIYFTIKIYIRNFYVCCRCDCGFTFHDSLSKDCLRNKSRENEMYTIRKTKFKKIINCIFALENIKLKKYERI